jgi:dUTP pyrophosphatase
MEIKVKKLIQSATIPTRAHSTDAGFDLYCAETVKLIPTERAQIKTGIAMEIPEGYVGLIWEKSGLSHRHGLKVLGGVIDSGYRGEILIGMCNLSEEKYTFEVGHKVAQILIQKIETSEIVEVENLTLSDRGEKGIGSTGK